VTRTDDLLAFCQDLHLDHAQLPAGSTEVEDPGQYTLNLELPSSAQQALSEAALNRLRPSFEAVMTLTIGQSGQPLLKVSPGRWPADLASRVARVQQAPAGQELTLEIDKRPLLGAYASSYPGVHVLYYLFGERLNRLLAGPLIDLDGALFVDDSSPTLVIVSDRDVHYAGPLLTIVGERRASAGGVRVSPAGASLLARLDRYRQAVADSLNWTGITLNRLTPAHLVCRSLGVDDAQMSEALARQLWRLTIVYSANRSTWNGAEFRVIYSGPDRTAPVTITDDGPLPSDTGLLARLAVWPYAGRSGDTDRLTMLQSVLARELGDDDGKVNARALASRLRELLDEARWHYRVYLDGQIDKHFQQLRTATEYAVDVAKKIGDTIDAMTKGLTEVVLATVAAIFVAIVTPLLKNDFPLPIIFILLLLYVVYLGAFQIWYRLGSMTESADLLRQEATERLETFKSNLGAPRIGPLIKQIDARWKLYDRWLSITRGLYRVVVGVMVVLAIIWPVALGPGGLGGRLAPPTATPTAPAVAPPTASPTSSAVPAATDTPTSPASPP
jgi:hypothetical protein